VKYQWRGAKIVKQTWLRAETHMVRGENSAIHMSKKNHAKRQNDEIHMASA
jgi:hypothetical protein